MASAAESGGTSRHVDDGLSPPAAVWTPAGRRVASVQARNDGLVASSPILNDKSGYANGDLPTPDSRDSSVRLSKNLENLRWEGSSIKDTDSLFRQSINSTAGDIETPSKPPATNAAAAAALTGEGDTDSEMQSDIVDSPNNAYAVLSKRADFILENAKRKLNLLEGNLGRARHSLLIPPSSGFDYRSMSPGSAQSTPSDDGNTRVPFPRINFAPSRESTRIPPSQRTFSNHNRFFSDTSIPTGGISIKGSRSLDHMQDRDFTPRRPYDRPSLEQDRDGPSLDTVVEDENTTPTHQRVESQTAKDLRAQAEELRNRISMLQQRSRDDSNKRRSLRMEREASRDFSVQVAALKDSLEQQEKVIDEIETAERSAERTAELDKDPRAEWHQVLEQNEASDGDDDSYSDDSSGYSSSDEYEIAPEDLEMPEDEDMLDGAHEDRADAFDYEHFILHSIMGGRVRGDSESSASSESTERLDSTPEDAENEVATTQDDVENGDADKASSKAKAKKAEVEAESDDGKEGPSEEKWPVPPSNGNGNGNASQGTSSATAKAKPRAVNPDLARLAEEAKRRPASLIVSQLTRPTSTMEPRSAILKQEDKALMYSCAESFRTVCMKLQRDDLGPHDGTDLRQRLEIAKRVLNGDL